MSFTDRQARALRAKLAHRHVRTRSSNGATIAYVEGWHVIAEANRIFGFDSWDRSTEAPICVWSETQRGQTVCFYSTRVRIKVRAGGVMVCRDGIGTGLGRSASPEQAHEIALKAAETDATKRALATFGNPFGLALYDKEQVGVTKPHPSQAGPPPRKELGARVGASENVANFSMMAASGEIVTCATMTELIATALAQVPVLPNLDALYDFWQRNLPVFKEVRRRFGGDDADPLSAVIQALKERARALGRNNPDDDMSMEANDEKPRAIASQTRSRLALPKERRIRDKEHLTYVGGLPCTVCGRQPSHAHHLRFAQPRAMAMKVSDEYTVPLCAIHHDELHRSGDERAWWARRGIIEPLKIAAKHWAASCRLKRGGVAHKEPDNPPEQPEAPLPPPEDRRDFAASGSSAANAYPD